MSQGLIDALQASEEMSRILREQLAARRNMAGRLRKELIKRQEAQNEIDKIQSDVVEVEKLILASHAALVKVGAGPAELPGEVEEEGG